MSSSIQEKKKLNGAAKGMTALEKDNAQVEGDERQTRDNLRPSEFRHKYALLHAISQLRAWQREEASLASAHAGSAHIAVQLFR